MKLFDKKNIGDNKKQFLMKKKIKFLKPETRKRKYKFVYVRKKEIAMRF